MNSILYYAPGDVRLEKVSKPMIKPGEVLVKVKVALTCGTDLKTFKRGHPVLLKSLPSPFGHEFSGIVEEVGEAVQHVQVGQRVVSANSAPCDQCHFCHMNRPNLCENLDLLNGAYAEYIVIPENIVNKNLLVLPDHVSYESAAFCEPLSVSLHGIDKSDITYKKNVCILGTGPIGMLMAKTAKLKGATVYMAGRNSFKLNYAKNFAHVDQVINFNDLTSIPQDLKKLSPDGRGFDVIIEAIGLPQMWENALEIASKGATINFFGGCQANTKVNLNTRKIHYDEIKMIGVFHHTPFYFREALRLISEGYIQPEKMITHAMDLKDLKKALDLQDSGEAIKIAVYP